jgi:predicted enzyme related to lactoylglutathione lyase
MHAVKVIAILVHVAEPEAAAAWYSRAFQRGRLGRVGDPSIPILELGSVRLEFVQADAKVSSGSAGTVVYWQVEDFHSALSHLESVGAQLYRGPLKIEEGQTMCQVKDPWGNCIGIRGKVNIQPATPGDL